MGRVKTWGPDAEPAASRPPARHNDGGGRSGGHGGLRSAGPVEQPDRLATAAQSRSCPCLRAQRLESIGDLRQRLFDALRFAVFFDHHTQGPHLQRDVGRRARRHLEDAVAAGDQFENGAVTQRGRHTDSGTPSSRFPPSAFHSAELELDFGDAGRVRRCRTRPKCWEGPKKAVLHNLRARYGPRNLPSALERRMIVRSRTCWCCAMTSFFGFLKGRLPRRREATFPDSLSPAGFRLRARTVLVRAEPVTVR